MDDPIGTRSVTSVFLAELMENWLPAIPDPHPVQKAMPIPLLSSRDAPRPRSHQATSHCVSAVCSWSEIAGDVQNQMCRVRRKCTDGSVRPGHKGHV